MDLFTEEHTAAHIVKAYPKASDLFKIHDINFCCKGDIALKDSFETKGINGTEVLQELNDSYREWLAKGNKAIDWDEQSITDITTHIKEHFHAYLEEELSSLGEFVTRIYQVHGHEAPHLKELYTLYNEFLIEAETHLIKEATEIIPTVEAYEDIDKERIVEEIKEWKQQNETLVQLLNEIRETTNHFEAPLDACGSYRITYARLLDLDKEMSDYMHLENNVLFNRLVA